jgi:hypothetical protein
MEHPRFSNEEIGRRGRQIYEERLRNIVETEENIGKILSIDIETGDYAIADDLLTSGRMMQTRHPGAALYGIRIGYDAVYAVGGSITRTAK